ncbi:MAG: hypothetical protein AAF747_07505 [Planctomycetota bacterium]
MDYTDNYRPEPASRMPTARRCKTICLFAATSLAMIAGCEQRTTQDEASPSLVELPSTEPTAADSAPAPTAEAELSDRPWLVPEGWTEDAAPRPMRVTTYIVPDASGSIEVGVTRFGGRVGGDLANINRWRGQMGLPPVDEQSLESVIERFSAPGFDGYQARIESESSIMLVAGVYDESIDQMWFVRATAPDAAAADRVQPALFSMARSIAGLEREPE